MQAKIIIEGLRPHDGEYELDISRFTMRELHTIKRIAGIRAGEIADALKATDTDVVVALAVVALNRAGKDPDEDRLWDSQTGMIKLVFEESDESPPEEEPAETGSTSSSRTNGGESSSRTSGPQANDLSRIGDHA